MFVVAPCVDFFGMISEQTGDAYGCSRLMRKPLPNPDICAFVGDRIQFKCTLAHAGKEVYAPLIYSPRETAIITGLVIEAFVDIEQKNDSGEYYCSFSTVSANGSVNRPIHVEVFGKYIWHVCMCTCEMNGYFINPFQIHLQ